MSMLSPAQILAALPDDEREEAFAALSPELRASLKYQWNFWARPNQLEPGPIIDPDGTRRDWTTWLILAGRGFGKTRTGAETIRSWVCGATPLSPGRCSRIALVAETAPDARDVMVEGPAGLLACHDKAFRPTYYPSKRMVEWPNGATALMFNAVEPDQLRGPQFDAAWCDELAKWRYAEATFDQLQFGLRLGSHPKQIITTTPRPIPVVRRLMNDKDTIVTRGRTYDNADNLAAPFMRQVEERYGGTRLGRQELEGEVLEDIPGALWSSDCINRNRRPEAPKDLIRIVVAVDPAATSSETADETGIVVVGYSKDEDGAQHGYVLHDGSCKGRPEEWAKAAVSLYHEYDADRIIAESNQGGEMVEAVIRAVDRNVPVTLVHASRGKRVRAEPVSALYEQDRVHHVGKFPRLEEQMCLFSGETGRSVGDSPDRVDALVWGVTALFDKITARRSGKSKTKVDFNNPHGLNAAADQLWMA